MKYLRDRLCIPIAGVNRAIIYDLSRQNYFFISLPLHQKIKTSSIIEFSEEVPELNDWEDFLVDAEILFNVSSCQEVQLFPEVSKEYETPHLLNSLVIHGNIDCEALSKRFQSIHLENVSVIVDVFQSKEVSNLLNNLCTLEIDSVNLYIKEEGDFEDSKVKSLRSISQLSSIFLFNSPEIRLPSDEEATESIKVFKLSCSFIDYISQVHPLKLQVNYTHFFEASNFNNYFFQKVYLDPEGNIKNGLLGVGNFGNIYSISQIKLKSIFKSHSFRNLGNVKKNETLICRECEFRFMCVDPRVPKLNSKGLWYHETECSYNPYISKWSHEQGFKTLEECGIQINLGGDLSINHNILEEKFNSVWDNSSS